MIRNYKYKFFTANEIKPCGWLKNQLRIQADGLCGNLDKVWPDIRDSAWIGGNREGWERVPYWLDGFIPLAYLLDDDDMKCRVKKYIDAIISFQREDGWICPCRDDERRNYDTWAVLLITKVLCLYGDCSGDERITEVVRKCLKQFDLHINSATLRNWGAARWFEGLISISWLYEKTHEKWLITLAKKLRVQGFDWYGVFKNKLLDDCTEKWEYYSHVVNIAMMLKSEALWSLFEDIDSSNFEEMVLEYLDINHGTAIGHFNGDECLSGNSPVSGAELCSIVELMYSYEVLFAVTGKTKWLDRLEVLAFNSLPAALSPDMWSHQYDQMVNQVACFPMSKQPFRTNDNVAHTFGLEPNFGCCTANFGQGFPKFALTTFMKKDNAIVSCALSPARLETVINGSKIVCELQTEYPFRNTLKYIITVDKETNFTFSLRIPAFAAGARVDGTKVQCGQFINITRDWKGTCEINVEFDFNTEIISRPEKMGCVRRGPLFYSIPIQEKWEKVEYVKDGVERKYPYCDYYIYPVSKWNYAIGGERFDVFENQYQSPFNPDTPPVSIECDAWEIPWDFNNGHCDPLPKSTEKLTEKQPVKMIPYGCTNLRMTEMPIVK